MNSPEFCRSWGTHVRSKLDPFGKHKPEKGLKNLFQQAHTRTHSTLFAPKCGTLKSRLVQNCWHALSLELWEWVGPLRVARAGYLAADPLPLDHIHQTALEWEDELFPEKDKLLCLSICLSVCLSICLSVCLSLLTFTLAVREVNDWSMIVQQAQRKNVLSVHVNEKDMRYSVQNVFLFQWRQIYYHPGLTRLAFWTEVLGPCTCCETSTSCNWAGHPVTLFSMDYTGIGEVCNKRFAMKGVIRIGYQGGFFSQDILSGLRKTENEAGLLPNHTTRCHGNVHSLLEWCCPADDVWVTKWKSEIFIKSGPILDGLLTSWKSFSICGPAGCSTSNFSA